MANDLETVRQWVGSTDPDDATINARILSEGSPLHAARFILRQRLADLIESAGKMSTHNYSEDNTENIRALKSQLEQLDGEISSSADSDGDGVPDGGRLYRTDRRWR